MAKLTTKRRKDLPKSKFALPEERKYPIDTKARAQNAKARVQQQYDKGNISAAKKAKVDRAANRVLKAKGAKTIEGKKVVRKGSASTPGGMDYYGSKGTKARAERSRRKKNATKKG